MQEPTRRTSRFLLIASTLGALGLAGSGFVAGRLTGPAAPAPVPPAETVPAPATPSVRPEPFAAAPLDRQRLSDLARRATLAYGTGAPLGPDDLALAGRRFAVAIPFGCGAPAPAETQGGLFYTYDAERERLRVSVQPQVWSDVPWIAGLLGAGPDAAAQGAGADPDAAEAGADAESETERVEGFWIARPWSPLDGCPRATTAAPGAPGLPAAIGPPEPPSLGLVQVPSADQAREGRRARQPYEFVDRVPPEALPGAAGFRILLGGRIGAFADGRPVACNSPSPDRRPTCLIAVRIDSVRLAQGATGAVLAEWST